MTDCNHNTDPQKLVREGTSQEQRPFQALDPAYAPVNEHGPAHSMVFAQAYAAYLRYFDTGDVPVDNWQRFFSRDVSVQLAVAAVQNVDDYRTEVKQYFDYLDNRQNISNQNELRDRLDYLFSAIATLALRLDELKESLPDELPLKNTLRNLVISQLAPAFTRLIAYREGGLGIADAETKRPMNVTADEIFAPLTMFGKPALPFSQVKTSGYSGDWSDNAAWTAYYASIVPDASVFGNLTGTSVFDRANHIATHNLFTSIFDQFLKAYARAVSDAKQSLENTFTNWDRHEPHYALFLAFLRLFEYARAEMNTLTGRHLDFYYRQILRLGEKPAEPGHVHLLVELAKHAAAHDLKPGEAFRAGKDALGNDAFFANDHDFVANHAKVAALKTVYRHGTEKVNNKGNHTGRLFASPVANSEDGLGAELLSADKSWHPFYNKVYHDGDLIQINMPKAEAGFAVASHYLLLAEGTRTITLDFQTASSFGGFGTNKVICLLTTEKGWIEKTPSSIGQKLTIDLTGEDPAVTPYLAKTHGYQFDTDLPVVLVKLINDDASGYFYPALQDVVVQKIDLTVQVEDLKTLAVANDFGPVDTSKPFQPFGASPVANNGLVVGSKEVFQKKIFNTTINITWKNAPAPYGTAAPKIQREYLKAGNWSSGGGNYSIGTQSFPFVDTSVVEVADFSANEQYFVGVRHGFVRLYLDADFGQGQYQTALLNFINKEQNAKYPSNPPQGPYASAISIDYSAKQTIDLKTTNTIAFNKRPAKFFHLAPFGHAEQHAALGGGDVALLPQFKHVADGFTIQHEAEFYIGVSGLKPPQNLALLFQVAEGTADPLSQKPDPHLHWSYLHNNTWRPFEKDAVEDQTGELTRSGIVTIAMPREANDGNTLLQPGMHWIRVAVKEESDTACRVVMVAAQALRATFTDRENDPAFTATPLEAGTIAKLDQPDSAVKKIGQPFASFGGRGKEAPDAYYTRVSERLRHKDRSIALWDYERLVLEAFPQIYKVKCLNHTQYEPSDIYRELAAGHVTVVTIPNQQYQNLRDPLRPYTSLGLLLEIETFLHQRLSCFAKLHVKNPQFEELQLNFRVRFMPGFDETFYTNKLKQEITRYLSPWAYPGGGAPSFGGKIYKSVLINFVEERPYVDYVTDFKLFHINGKNKSADLNEAEGSTAVSILVSVPEEKHEIKPITLAEVAALAQSAGEDCSCKK